MNDAIDDLQFDGDLNAMTALPRDAWSHDTKAYLRCAMLSLLKADARHGYDDLVGIGLTAAREAFGEAFADKCDVEVAKARMKGASDG